MGCLSWAVVGGHGRGEWDWKFVGCGRQGKMEIGNGNGNGNGNGSRPSFDCADHGIDGGIDSTITCQALALLDADR